MESYIVRIYRWEGVGHCGIAGTLEKVGTEEKRAFCSEEDLIYLLRQGRAKGEKKPTVANAGNRRDKTGGNTRS